jgi:4-hydroxythreonine-4-phosphate dehydrogenase
MADTRSDGAPPAVAMTMGDPAGIGPEIIVKLARLRPTAGLLVIGDVGVIERAARLVGEPSCVRAASNARDIEPGRLNVIQVGEPLGRDIIPGRIDARAGAAAFAYVQRAIDLALAGDIDAIVTAPVSKEAMALAGVTYPGHTEILADRCGVRDYAMLLANDDLRVLLVSIHVSLVEAIAAVTVEAELTAIRLAHEACRAFGVQRPRVAVAGLNPHAGERGMFGREDIDVIAPAVARARAEGIDASGPWPGDTVFMRARQGAFDIVVAQYHDQGLIPVKYLGVDKGVNITVGLPFVRTSVDHGTAFDIAGTGQADPSSLACAYDQALAMAAGNLRRAQRL